MSRYWTDVIEDLLVALAFLLPACNLLNNLMTGYLVPVGSRCTTPDSRGSGSTILLDLFAQESIKSVVGLATFRVNLSLWSTAMVVTLETTIEVRWFGRAISCSVAAQFAANVALLANVWGSLCLNSAGKTIVLLPLLHVLDASFGNALSVTLRELCRFLLGASIKRAKAFLIQSGTSV